MNRPCGRHLSKLLWHLFWLVLINLCFSATQYLLLMHSILFIFKAVGLFRVSCYRLKHRIFASLRMCVVMLWSLYNVCIHFFGVMLYAPFSNNTVCIQCVHFIRVFHAFAWAFWAWICIGVCLMDEMCYNKFYSNRICSVWFFMRSVLYVQWTKGLWVVWIGFQSEHCIKWWNLPLFFVYALCYNIPRFTGEYLLLFCYCVRFSFFSTIMLSAWLGRTSPKWPIFGSFGMLNLHSILCGFSFAVAVWLSILLCGTVVQLLEWV